MAAKAHSITPKKLVNQLVKKDLLSGAAEKKARQFLKDDKNRVPVILQIFAGLGAFLSAIPFLIFLFVAGFFNFDTPSQFMVWGLLFIGMAIPLGRANRNSEKLLSVYFQQISLIFMGIGKVLAIIGGVELLPFDENWNAVLMIFILAAATYYYFGSSVDRFLSVLIALVSVPIAIATDRNIAPEIQELLLNGYFVLQIALAGFLTMKNRLTSIYIPLYFSVIFSLANVVLKLSATSSLADLLGIGFAYNTYLISTILGALFLLLIYLGSTKLSTLKTEQIIVLAIGIIVLTLLPAPGVLFALIMLFLGYRDYNNFLTLIGLGFLAYFIFKFYYDLNFSLLMKSIILMSSGALLVFGHLIMHIKKWHRGK